MEEWVESWKGNCKVFEKNTQKYALYEVTVFGTLNYAVEIAGLLELTVLAWLIHAYFEGG